MVSFIAVQVQAQEQLINMAKQYMHDSNYVEAAKTLQQLLEYKPKDAELNAMYYESLLGMKDYKNAKKIINAAIKQSEQPDTLQFQLAQFYIASGDVKKADKILAKISKKIPDDYSAVKKLATQFEKAGMTDNAINILEKAKEKHSKENPYVFAEELAILYDKKGDSDKATESLLDIYITQPDKNEEIKATLLRMLNTAQKTEALRKKITTRIQKDESNFQIVDLLAWIYIQQKDYASAFTQLKSIDIRTQENGRRIIGFARVCLREKEYKTAIDGYNYVLEKGNEQPFYKIALSEKLTTLKEQLTANATYTTSDLVVVENAYEKTISDFPDFKKTETIREYANFEALYMHNIEKAITSLKEVTQANNVDRQFKARCKLDMGDYELIRGDKWESSLLYSQIDKEFKQDALGEEARYRNAKLSYYLGDFEWAQGQLDVLKASTTELIANDALNLSVLITENNPIADSNVVPLEMFARANLLQFQHKYEDAIRIFDSIKNEYPKHPLIDNIYMERANIATEKHEYNEAAMYYQKVINEFSDEILADDAMYRLAGINEKIFNNKDEAKRLYETILTKYPGSSFVTDARKHFRRLRGDVLDSGL